MRDNFFSSSGELGQGQPRAKEKKHPRIRVSDIAPRAKEKKGLRIRFSDIAPGRASETFSARCEVIARTPSLSAIGKIASLNIYVYEARDLDVTQQPASHASRARRRVPSSSLLEE